MTLEPGVPGLLARLAGLLGGAVAVVSGRPLADDIDRHLPTAALFDLGVFAVLAGSTLLLTAIAHQLLLTQAGRGRRWGST